jgi:hypothetical protein
VNATSAMRSAFRILTAMLIATAIAFFMLGFICGHDLRDREHEAQVQQLKVNCSGGPQR